MAKQESENDLCRCCHSEGSYRQLYASYFWLEAEEVVFFNMLQECFDIEMTPVNESLQHMLCSICHTCIERLQDAIKFKRQIQKCERRFREVYGSCVGEPEAEVKIKEEVDVDMEELKTLPVDQDKDQMLERPTSSKMAKEFDKLINDDDDRSWSASDDEDLFAKSIENKSAPTTTVKKKSTSKEPAKNKSRKGVKRKASVTDSTADAAEDNQPSGDQDLDSEKTEQIEVIDEYEPIKKKTRAPSQRNRQYKRYSEQDLTNAIEAVKSNKMSCIKAAEMFNIPRRTLRTKLHTECGEGTKSRSQLVNVYYKKTKDSFQCLKCPAVIKNTRWGANLILRHVRSVHFNTAKYKCPVCSELFWKPYSFVRHKLVKHNIDDRINCNACDKSFCSKQALVDHLAGFHMMGPRHKCEECGFETHTKKGIQNHKLNHSNVKNHQCQYCQKKFKRNTTLKLHEKIHTGEKNKVCSECGQAFVQRASLKYHMHKQHPGVDF